MDYNNIVGFLKKEKIVVGIVLLYAVLFFIFLSSFAFDDLGFDFAGYALRYKFAFSGWIKELLLGIPAGVFDGELPSILPLFFQSIGLGSFTFPLALSILLLELCLPLVFVYIGRFFKIGWKKSAFFGLLFVLNPFTFKFFNRYYEFAAWFLLFVSFYFYYSFLQSKNFDKKNFAFAVIFSVAMALSHPSALLFWGIALFSLTIDFIDLKRFATVGFFVGGIACFWLLPFLGYSQYSVVTGQNGSELMTGGIKAASYFFAIALPAVLFFFSQKLEENKRIFRLLCVAAVLAVVYAIAPGIPLLNIPFAHSFHIFFLFVLFLSGMQLAKENSISKKQFSIALIAVIVCLIAFFPIVERQYFFQEPRYSNYESNGQRINYSEFESLVENIPKNERFETLPEDMVLAAKANSKGWLTLRGWGYNAYALKESDDIGRKLTSMSLSCEEFIAGSKKTATPYWIALNETGQKYLINCGLKKIEGNLPTLFFLDSNNTGLVDGGELLRFENKIISFKATEEIVLVKSSFFPKWHAFSDGKELSIEDAKPGMLIKTVQGSVVDLKYENTIIDFAGIAVSIIALILLFLAMF